MDKPCEHKNTVRKADMIDKCLDCGWIKYDWGSWKKPGKITIGPPIKPNNEDKDA